MVRGHLPDLTSGPPSLVLYLPRLAWAKFHDLFQYKKLEIFHNMNHRARLYFLGFGSPKFDQEDVKLSVTGLDGALT